jgi:hypothetical protein
MNKIIATLTMTFLVIFPLIRFYQRNNWEKKIIWINLILIIVIWFSSYALFHELSHMIGTYLVGGTVTDYQLIPEFWKGDFRTAYITPENETTFQEFVTRLSPYVRDLLLVIIGFLVLRKQKIINSFIVGLIVTLFLLSSLFDIVSNFLGFAIDHDGDFNGLAKLTGKIWVYLIGISIFCIEAWTTFRVFQIYRNFPKRISTYKLTITRSV